MKLKRLASLTVSALLVLTCFSSCGNSKVPGEKNEKQENKPPQTMGIIDDSEKTTLAEVTAITAATGPDGKVTDKEGITDASGHKVYSTGQKDSAGNVIYTTGKLASNGKVLYTKNKVDSFGNQIYYTGKYNDEGKLIINPTAEKPDYTTNDKPKTPYEQTTTTSATVGYKDTSKTNLKGFENSFLSYFGGSASDNFLDMKPCSDGGFVAGGYSQSKNGDCENVPKEWAGHGMIVKFKADGSTAWKYFVGGDSEMMIYSVCELKDGSVVGAGYTLCSDTDAPMHSKNISAYLVKLSKNGELVWEYSFPGDAEQEGEFIKCIAATPDGGFVVGGKANSSAGFFSGEGRKAFVFKFDKNCNVKWRRILTGSKSNSFEGISVADNGDIYALCVTVSTDGDFSKLIKGKDFANNSVLVKLSKNGDLKWSKNLDGTGNSEFSAVYASNDGCLVGGSYTIYKKADGIYSLSYGQSDGYLIRYDGDGNVCWARNVGGSANDYVSGVTKVDGGFAVCGKTYSNDFDFQGQKLYGGAEAFVILIDENGKTVDTSILSGTLDEDACTICTLKDGSVAFGGFTKSSDNAFSASKSNKQVTAFAGSYKVLTGGDK